MQTTTEVLFFASANQVVPPIAFKFYSCIDTNENRDVHRVLIEVYDDVDDRLMCDDLYGDPFVERICGQYVDFSTLAAFVDQVRGNLHALSF
jgi:hypothetical protein